MDTIWFHCDLHQDIGLVKEALMEMGSGGGPALWKIITPEDFPS